MKPIDVLHDPQKAKEVAAADLPQFIAAIGVLRDRAEIAFAALTARVPWAYRDVERAESTREASNDRYLTIPEVKQRLGLSRSHLYALVRTGDLPAKPLGRGGRGYRVLLSDLLAWEARQSKNTDGAINKMLNSKYDRRRASKAPSAA